MAGKLGGGGAAQRPEWTEDSVARTGQLGNAWKHLGRAKPVTGASTRDTITDIQHSTIDGPTRIGIIHTRGGDLYLEDPRDRTVRLIKQVSDLSEREKAALERAGLELDEVIGDEDLTAVAFLDQFKRDGGTDAVMKKKADELKGKVVGSRDDVKKALERDQSTTGVDDRRHRPVSRRTSVRAPLSARADARRAKAEQRRRTGGHVETAKVISIVDRLRKVRSESYDGEKLVRAFPILFANKKAANIDEEVEDTPEEVEDTPPVGIGDCGLSLIAVGGVADHGKIEGVPDYASFLGKKHVRGNGMVAFFVVDKKNERKIAEAISKAQPKLKVDYYDKGIYVAATRFGVKLSGPGMGIVKTFNKQSAQAEGEVRLKLGRNVPKVNTSVDLDKQVKASACETEPLPNMKSSRRAFIFELSLGGKFGVMHDSKDVARWQDLSEKISQYAAKNNCFVDDDPVNGVYRIITRIDRPTALETQEAAALAMSSSLDLLKTLNSSTKGRMEFAGKFFQSNVRVDRDSHYSHSPVVRGGFMRDASKLPSHKGHVTADDNAAQFDPRVDSRQTLVGTYFRKHPQAKDVYLLEKLRLVKNRIDSQQLPEFFGREDELRRFDEACDRSREGAQFIRITGISGAGKSSFFAKAAANRLAKEKAPKSCASMVVCKEKEYGREEIEEQVQFLLKFIDSALVSLGQALPAAVQSKVKVLRAFVVEDKPEGYLYKEKELVDAFEAVLIEVSPFLQTNDWTLILANDDIDASGKAARGFFGDLYARIKRNREKFKHIAIPFMLRSIKDHAQEETGARRWVDANVGSLVEKGSEGEIFINEHVLRSVDAEGEVKYVDGLEHFITRRVFGKACPESARIDTGSLIRLGLICSHMASNGGKLESKETKVSGYNLRVIIDILRSKGFLTIDVDAGTIKFSTAQLERAKGQLRTEDNPDGILPCGPANIFASQFDRVASDPYRKNIILFAEILRGTAYDILENDEIVALVSTGENQDLLGGFKRILEDFREKESSKPGEEVQDRIFSKGENIGVHGLWSDAARERMKEVSERDLVLRLQKLALDVLQKAMKLDDLSDKVNPVMIFELAGKIIREGAGEEFVKIQNDVALAAAEKAMQKHDYPQVIKCAEKALGISSISSADKCKANFLLAKANIALGDLEKGRRLFRADVIPNLALLSQEMKADAQELHLRTFNDSFVQLRGAGTTRALPDALKAYSKVVVNMSRSRKSVRKILDAGNFTMADVWPSVNLAYHSLEVLYFSAYINKLENVDLEDSDGLNDQDKAYNKVNTNADRLSKELDEIAVKCSSAKDIRAINAMKAKVLNMKVTVTMQQSRFRAAGDEVVNGMRLASHEERYDGLVSMYKEIVGVAGNIIRISRQSGGLGMDHAVEAKVATMRLYAAAHTSFDPAELKRLISDFVEYSTTLTDIADRHQKRAQAYVALSARLFVDTGLNEPQMAEFKGVLEDLCEDLVSDSYLEDEAHVARLSRVEVVEKIKAEVVKKIKADAERDGKTLTADELKTKLSAALSAMDPAEVKSRIKTDLQTVNRNQYRNYYAQYNKAEMLVMGALNKELAPAKNDLDEAYRIMKRLLPISIRRGAAEDNKSDIAFLMARHALIASKLSNAGYAGFNYKYDGFGVNRAELVDTGTLKQAARRMDTQIPYSGQPIVDMNKIASVSDLMQVRREFSAGVLARAMAA